MDLACLKGFVDAKSFCQCKLHDIRLRFICLEPTCNEKLEAICQLCLKSNHKNHDNIEITKLYNILINEMAGEEQNMSLNKEKLIEKDIKLNSQIKKMDDLLFDIEILFKTVKQLYKDTKNTTDNLKKLIKETYTPSQSVYHQIENSLIGKHWKESTQKGLNFRIKNIFDNITCSAEGNFQIENSSPQTQHISNQIDYLLKFYNTRLQECQFKLEECFEMVNLKFKFTNQLADQISFANIYTEENLQFLPSSTTKIWVHYIQEETEQHLLQLENPQIAYFDIPGKIGQNKYSLSCIKSFTKKFGQNLFSLLINMNGWQNLTFDHFKSIDEILLPCQNIKVLVLNLFNWNILQDNTENRNEDTFSFIIKSIGRMKTIEALTLFGGKWNQIKSEHINLLANTVAELPHLQSLDLQFPECKDHQVNDEAIKYMNEKFKLLPTLTTINLNLNCWYNDKSKLTEVSLNSILSSLMSRSYTSYSLSIMGSNGIPEAYLNRLSYEMKKVKFATFLY